MPFRLSDALPVPSPVSTPATMKAGFQGDSCGLEFSKSADKSDSTQPYVAKSGDDWRTLSQPCTTHLDSVDGVSSRNAET